MIWVWILLLFLVVLAACDQAYRWYVTPRISDIFENVPPFNVAVETAQSDAESISIVTHDGVILRGSLINGNLANARGLVLFLPELRGNHWMAKRYCAALINDGYMVLSVDFRSQGESGAMPDYTAQIVYVAATYKF